MGIIKLTVKGLRNEPVDAEVREYDQTADSLKWFLDWLPMMYDLAGHSIFEDSHWDVPKIWDTINETNDSLVIILEAKDKIQGYVTLYFVEDVDGNKYAYIPFLSVAPWNRLKTRSDEREFRNIGKILVAISSLISYTKTNSFVIKLHSLPGSEGFYKKIGMAETGALNCKKLKEFILDEQKACDLVRFIQPYLSGGGE